MITMIICYGFMLVTFYTSYLGSFLVKISDNQRFRIICEEKNYKTFLTFKPEAETEVQWDILSFSEFNDEVERLDSSTYGYCVQSNVWDIYSRFQDGLVKKKFQRYQQWETPKNLPHRGVSRKAFLKIFDVVLINTFSSGLNLKWNNDFFFRKYINNFVNTDRKALTELQMRLEDSTFAFYLLLTGSFLSMCVFVGELFVVKFWVRK